MNRYCSSKVSHQTMEGRVQAVWGGGRGRGGGLYMSSTGALTPPPTVTDLLKIVKLCGIIVSPARVPAVHVIQVDKPEHDYLLNISGLII